eukprot:TRINITY_DN3754_c0_g1_i2.p1 TRINITY_DN3754_c0_g1~~TRINITY_DN3754_c0_g1_i2.p1  ORF type:complete len:673 (+),score=107.70 TRINITY_DN3754_c0_g1_i2:197-2215(+)
MFPPLRYLPPKKSSQLFYGRGSSPLFPNCWVSSKEAGKFFGNKDIKSDIEKKRSVDMDTIYPKVTSQRSALFKISANGTKNNVLSRSPSLWSNSHLSSSCSPKFWTRGRSATEQIRGYNSIPFFARSFCSMEPKNTTFEYIDYKEELVQLSPNKEVRLLKYRTKRTLADMGDEFIIDHSDISGRLSEWLNILKKNAMVQCAIVGPVKSGKSAAMNVIFPKMARKVFPDAVFASLSFESFSTTTREDFLTKLYLSMSNWATREGFVVGPQPSNLTSKINLEVAITELLTDIDTNGKHVFFLWDEIQNWFLRPSAEVTKEIERQQATFFKHLMQPRDNIHFLVTGSGMVQALRAFLRAPANGFTLNDLIQKINIQSNDDTQITKLALEELDKRDPSQNLSQHLAVSLNPSGINYAAYVWTKILQAGQRDREKLAVLISNKYLEEFFSDMFPLLQMMEDYDRKTLRSLAEGTFKLVQSDQNQPPFQLKDMMEVLNFLLITTHDKEGNRTYRFASDEFSNLILKSISEDGTIPSELRSRLASIWKSDWEFVRPIGETVAKLLQSSDKQSALVELQRIEDMATKIANQHNWEIPKDTNPSYSFLINHQNNSSEKAKAISGKSLLIANNLWFCLWFKLARNYISHSLLEDREKAAQHVPSFSQQLYRGWIMLGIQIPK